MPSYVDVMLHTSMLRGATFCLHVPNFCQACWTSLWRAARSADSERPSQKSKKLRDGDGCRFKREGQECYACPTPCARYAASDCVPATLSCPVLYSLGETPNRSLNSRLK